MDFGTIPVPEHALKELSVALCDPRNLASVSEDSNKVDQILYSVIQTAAFPLLPSAHRAVAIDSLCAIVCGTTKSKFSDNKIWTNRRWEQCLSIYLDYSDSSKGKAMRQLLKALMNALHNCNSISRSEIRSNALNAVVPIILGKSSKHVKMKPAIQFIEAIVSKQVATLPDVLDAFQVVSREPAFNNDNTIITLLRKLFDCMQNQHLSLSASHAICALCRSWLNQVVKDRVMSDTTLPIWANPLMESMRKSPESTHRLRSQLFPNLFRSDLQGYYNFLILLGIEGVSQRKVGLHNTETYGDSENFSILLAALQAGKEIGLVTCVESNLVQFRDKIIGIPTSTLCSLLVDSENDIRIAGLDLLVSSSSTTEPFSASLIYLIRFSLRHFILETEAYTRGEVLGLFRRLLERLRAIIASLHRKRNGLQPRKGHEELGADSKPTSSEAALGNVLALHESLVKDIYNLIVFSLRPDAGYQEHIWSLKALSVLSESGLDPGVESLISVKQASHNVTKAHQVLQIFTPRLLRLLFDRSLDAFEDVRSLSSSLLGVGLNIQVARGRALSALSIHPRQLIRTSIERGERLLTNSGRADHADGVSRLYATLFSFASDTSIGDNGPDEWHTSKLGIFQHLLGKMNQTLRLASNDLSLAVTQAPIHGIIASIRAIFENINFSDHDSLALHPQRWRQIILLLIEYLRRVWETVQSVLCNDAPEGHMPEDFDAEVEFSTKDVLSYCWRALRESSNLLRTMVLKVPLKLRNNGTTLFATQELDSMTNLCFLQLSELRHRGAFSAVAQAFAACCSRNNRENKYERILYYYEEALRCIRKRGGIVTRRSAGIPSILIGVISADPKCKILERAISDFKTLIVNGPKLETENPLSEDIVSQVHALNCLKAFFTTASLGAASHQFIVDGLEVASICLNSDIWALRNCGLMLFRALIDRLSGQAESQTTSDELGPSDVQFSYQEYPNLLEIILNMLSPRDMGLEASESAIECVFPGLKIIQRFPPPKTSKTEFQRLIIRLLGSSQWSVRNMAARTFARLIETEDRLQTILRCLENDADGTNQIHGNLLCVFYLLKAEFCQLSWLPAGFSELLSIMSKSATSILRRSRCPFVYRAIFDIYNEIGMHLMSSEDHSVCRAYLSFEVDHILSPFARSESFVHTSNPSHFAILHISHAVNLTIRSVIWGKLMEDVDGYTGSILAVHKLFTRLGEIDPNGFVGALKETIDLNLPIENKLRLCLSDIISETVCSTSHSELRSIGQAFLIDSLDFVNMSANKLCLLKEATVSRRADSPSSLPSGTLLWAALLKKQHDTLGWTDIVIQDTLQILAACRLMLEETYDFSIRIAGIKALQLLSHVWSTQKRAHNLQIRAMLIAYDGLNDDDDEVRNLAAKVTSLILSKRKSQQRKSTVPIIASRLLSRELALGFPTSRVLCREAISRMIGCKFQQAQVVPSALARFDSARQEDTALFLVEKQNLYVNEVREALIWSRVLRTVNINAAGVRITRALQVWTRDALVQLAQCVESTEPDGPLGWTSKAEVFVFGMQAFCAAEVLLHWRALGLNVELSTVIEALGRLSVSGKVKNLHESWQEKVDLLLEAAVIQIMSLTAQQLSSQLVGRN